MKYNFGDIVVVGDGLVGVIVNSWGKSLQGKPPHHEVYVRSLRCISEYDEDTIEFYQYPKEINY